MRPWVMLLVAGCVACASRGSRQTAASYVAPQGCQPCHVEISRSYQQVAMARSLYRPSADPVIEDYERNNHFYHAASKRHYRMIRREGKFYQRRYQLDPQGREIHVLEQEVSYIVGSGSHARSYLHLSEGGELTELPITWYSQERRWGMSPGYDKARHLDFSRQIDHGCLFCHNAYPAIPAGSDRYGAEAQFPRELPAGIDCQRCHGPGSRHVELASGGRSTRDEIRAAIVNPARLSPERQLDVCLECHLEITSAKLPQAVRRFARPAYSFRPGQRLSDYLVYFDHPPGAGYDDKFEIASAGYRLKKSACFLKSQGRLTCVTCHNPHRTPRGDEAIGHFRARCIGCHSQVRQPHPDLAASNCLPCHMPRRRTDDVVHVVMTDHLIQRRKPDRDLLAPLEEKEVPYRGDLMFYDPPRLGSPERELYLGIALEMDGAGRKRGIALIEKGIAAAGKATPLEAYIELAGAYMADGNQAAAAENYRKALAIDPRLARVRYNLGLALEKLGDTEGALAAYEEAVRESPGLAEAHNNLGTLLVRSGRAQEAVEHYRSAIRARPVYPEAHNNLGNLNAQLGRLEEARAQLEQALADEPSFAEAHNNLGKVLGALGRLDLAVKCFERAVQLDPRFAEAHYNRGRLLHEQGKREAAIAEYRRAIDLGPGLAEPHASLGVALAEKAQLDAAIVHLREALRLRPGYAEAQKNLDLVLEMRSKRQ